MKKNILGVDISNTTEGEVLEYIFASLEKKSKPYYIVTPNPEMIVRSQKDQSFKAVLNGAVIALCDGVGIFLAGRLLGKPFRERVTGVDLLEKVCKESVRNPVNIGFLGGKAGVAEKAAECLEKKFGRLNIAYISEEWDEAGFDLAAHRRTTHNQTQSNAESKVSKVPRTLPYSSAPIDILFVAFGFPKQEKWMAEHKDKGIYKIAMGVGGSFDYLSGNVQRAPRFLRAIGLEWFYRLIRQPWRWKRQLALLRFVWLVIKEKNRR